MRVRYFVNKEEGVVVCVGQNCMFDLVKELGVVAEDYSPFILNEEYRGIARLQDGDVWDEKFGKELAYSKMVTKYRNAKQKKVNMIIKDTEDTLNFLKNLSESYKK